MQCDKKIYSQLVYKRVSQTENLELRQEEVTKLIIKKGCCVGVITQNAEKIFSKAVIISTGTFMEAVMHFGLKRVSGGRDGDRATQGLSQQLSNFDFKVTRLKTGTPPRLNKESINWSCMEIQKGDKKYIPFSYKNGPYLRLPQIDCYLTYTNEKTHKVIRNNLDQSPLFSGLIEGIGPRYCPSIEDKLVRFSDKKRHQTFLEQESLDTNSIYLQGMSTSLPESVQYEFLKTIRGLENVKILKPGYAVEYDFIEPTEDQTNFRNKKKLTIFF